MKIIAKNKNKYKYKIIDSLVAGIALKGAEIKSIRNNEVTINDAYIVITNNNEAKIIGMNISSYKYQTFFELDPKRTRNLLLHKKEILRWRLLVKKQTATIIPLLLFWEKKFVKIQIAIAKGLKLYQKKHQLKEKSLFKELKKEHY